MTTWLLTGGAGYIGPHVLRSLLDSGRSVVVLDDLSTGLPRKIPHDVPFVEADIRDTAAVTAALLTHGCSGIVHLAARKAVGESIKHPLHYWHVNVEGFRSLLAAAVEAQVAHVVLSSSAACYGTPSVDNVTEDVIGAPLSPYGSTKLACEVMLGEVAEAYGLRHTSLRYFNVAGAGCPELGDTGVFNLIPMVFRRLDAGQQPQVFGHDYPTVDGTYLRDYIHVADLADAHVAAAAALETATIPPVLNVSTGTGASVLEVVDAVRLATQIDFKVSMADRRPGDPPRLVGDPTLIRQSLSWTSTRDLNDMVESAWKAWRWSS